MRVVRGTHVPPEVDAYALLDTGLGLLQQLGE